MHGSAMFRPPQLCSPHFCLSSGAGFRGELRDIRMLPVVAGVETLACVNPRVDRLTVYFAF
jgi:hypothetical protein